MPFYEYECNNCHESYTELRRMEQRDERLACPQCGSTKTERKVSVFATCGSDTSRPSSSSGCAKRGGFG